jgi:predicted flavoprotein YhiN
MTYADDAATITHQRPPLWAHRGLSGPPLLVSSPYPQRYRPSLTLMPGPGAVRPPCALKRALPRER